VTFVVVVVVLAVVVVDLCGSRGTWLAGFLWHHRRNCQCKGSDRHTVRYPIEASLLSRDRQLGNNTRGGVKNGMGS
jgi:hypothetical protein